MKPYIITADLEKTGLSVLDAQVATKALEGVRESTLESVNRALWVDITRVYTYREISDWMKSQASPEREFSLSVDNWVYMKDADFYFDSTRMYKDEESILEAPSSYNIMTRSGSGISRQCIDIAEGYNGKKVIIYDDGIFSWDTLRETIWIIQSNANIVISEIRVVLNFSGSDNLGGIPIKAMYTGECTDWIDERDFFYGVDMWGASINANGNISGVPYVSNAKLVAKKASIPTDVAKRFCLDMLDINQDFWRIKQDSEKQVARLMDVPRLQYLQSKYEWFSSIEEVLDKERERV